MTKEEFFKKARALKDKAAEKTKPTREKAKAKLDDACTWVGEHKGMIAATAFGALIIHVRGYMKGHEDGRVSEHALLERRHDTAYKLALKKAGVTEEEVDTLNEIQEMVDDFGGLEEVRFLFEGDYDEWCRLRSEKEEEEDD